jgi:putative DNA primase/helicase
MAVNIATAAYLEGEDAIAAWLEEKCDRDKGGWTSSADLFASWSAWATVAGEPAGSAKSFGQKLEVRGIIPKRDTTGKRRGYGGVRLI